MDFSNYEVLTLVVVLVIGIGLGVALHSFLASRKTCKGKKSQILLQDPQAMYHLPLIEKEIISDDTRRFRLGLPSENHVLGLPTGQHIEIFATINREMMMKSYTPVSSDDDHGFVDLIVKIYFKDVHPQFPEGGKMSQHLESLKIGEAIAIRGPSGRLVYNSKGNFTTKLTRKHPYVKRKVRKVAMIAGGTGTAPMLQLIRGVTKNPEDTTLMSLLVANQSEGDILLKNELEKIQRAHPHQLKLWYTLDSCNEHWKYSTGSVNADMMREHVLPPSSDTMVLICGPPPMINSSCIPILDQLGYDKKMRFVY